MADTITEMIGDVYTIKGITGSRQLIEFYKEVVKGNYEKYVAITKENIKYGYDSDRQKPIRLGVNQEYAINPNYRPIEIKEEEEVVQEVAQPVVEEVVTPEVVEEVPVQVVEEKVQEVVVAEPVQEVVEQPADVVDYKQLYMNAQSIIKQLEGDVALHKERADVAEHDNSTLREMKVVNEGCIEEFKMELDRRITELNAVIAENNELKEAIKNNSVYTELDTDTLIAHLANKGYKVSITR